MENAERVKYLIKLINKQTELTAAVSQLPFDMGQGDLLFAAELRMLTTIRDNPQCNTTMLADMMGVSKVAVSKLTDRLVHKDCLVKYHAPGNNKKIYYKLTDKGEHAYIRYMASCARSNNNKTKYLKGFSADEIESLISFMEGGVLSLIYASEHGLPAGTAEE